MGSNMLKDSQNNNGKVQLVQKKVGKLRSSFHTL